MSPRPRRIVLTIAAIPVCLALVVSLLFAAWLHGWRLPMASGTTWFEVTKTGDAHYNGEPDQPVFFLVIGNDARPGVGGARGDALHVIGVNPALHQATIIDIPRDTAAAIPGHGTTKINAANSYGGPRLSAQTVGNLLGIKIPYVIQTDFAGFTGMIDEVGGLDVNVPYSMHDKNSGSAFNPGVVHMSGERTLAFSRDRHSFPTGDLKRSENQGLVIIAALAKFRAQHTGATGTLEALAVLGRHTQLDGIGLRDLYRLARLGLSVDPALVKNVVIPVGSGSNGNLRLLPSAPGLFADFRDDAVLQTH